MLVALGFAQIDARIDALAKGTIVVRGSLVMAGYYKNPEATEAASAHGWHHTGDIGYLDEDGYLFIVDRLKDMIITGGLNVYSAEVEQALMQHPAVRDCGRRAAGRQVGRAGHRGDRADREVQPDELSAFVKARIGSVKTPKQVEVWRELPRSRLGKVLKAEVRTELARTRPGRVRALTARRPVHRCPARRVRVGLDKRPA